MDQDLVTRILFMVMTTFVFVVFFIPFVKKIAFHVGALDVPNARKIHTKPMPRLGGLGIFFGFLFGYMIFGTHSAIMNSILISSFIVVLTGAVDDIKPLKASHKFVAQFAAACVLVFYGNILLKDISAFGLYIDFGIFSIPLTLFFILGCINCMNLIDGMDGLAAGISSIYFITIGIIAVIQQKYGLDFILTFVMLGSTLGFLVHNFHPASIFMGDSGSMFLGLIISVIALLGFKNVTMTSIIIPLLLLAIPILDTLFAIMRRWLKGESLSTPDKYHIHHQLLKRNLSQRTTVLIIYLINSLFAFASILYILKDRTIGYIVYASLFIVIALFVVKTNIVYDNETVKENLKTRIFKNKEVAEKKKIGNATKKTKTNVKQKGKKS